jgi:hypothetical protein
MSNQYQTALERNFGFRFPADFFRFQDFLLELDKSGITLGDESLGISPANIFQIFDDPSSTDLETPFYRDPPEFLTVLLGDTDGLHWGYYLDDSAHGPSAVASYYHNDVLEFSLARDLFQAVVGHAEDTRAQVEELLQTDPASASEYRERIGNIKHIQEVVARYQSGGSPERRITAPTRDRAGIVVPEGTYAPLAGNDPFQEAFYSPGPDEVHRLRAAALDAAKHGFPGTPLKLGKDLWDYSDFFEVSCELLAAAYQGLNRPLLGKRLEAVRKFRKSMDAERSGRRRGTA